MFRNYLHNSTMGEGYGQRNGSPTELGAPWQSGTCFSHRRNLPGIPGPSFLSIWGCPVLAPLPLPVTHLGAPPPPKSSLAAENCLPRRVNVIPRSSQKLRLCDAETSGRTELETRPQWPTPVVDCLRVARGGHMGLGATTGPFWVWPLGRGLLGH